MPLACEPDLDPNLVSANLACLSKLPLSRVLRLPWTQHSVREGAVGVREDLSAAVTQPEAPLLFPSTLAHPQTLAR